MIVKTISKSPWRHRWHRIYSFVIHLCGVSIYGNWYFHDVFVSWYTEILCINMYDHKHSWIYASGNISVKVLVSQKEGNLLPLDSKFGITSLYSCVNQIEQLISMYLDWCYNTVQLFLQVYKTTNFTIVGPQDILTGPLGTKTIGSTTVRQLQYRISCYAEVDLRLVSFSLLYWQHTKIWIQTHTYVFITLHSITFSTWLY